MTQADVQIQRMEHEKAQALAELEPALKRQADLQVQVSVIPAVLCHLFWVFEMFLAEYCIRTLYQLPGDVQCDIWLAPQFSLIMYA